MRKTIIDQATNIVVNVINLTDGAQWPLPDGQIFGADGGNINDIWNGKAYTPPPLPPLPALTQDDYTIAIQNHIDTVAKKKDYTDGNACVSYKSSTVAQWAAEATAFIAWRDAVWLYSYNQLTLVQSKKVQQPTIEEFIAKLPTITWP